MKISKKLRKYVGKVGVALLSFLLAKAISPIAEATTSQTQSPGHIRDISRLPQLEKKEWDDACLQELEALRRRKVL